MRKRRGADFYCGMGGLTTAAMAAAQRLGIEFEDFLAINHWRRAIETHSTNHPSVRHLCARLEHVRPEDAVPSGRLHLLLASPECTHHSNARGGGATVVAMEHGGRAVPVTAPLPTITTARGGAFGVAFLLPQQSGGALRPVTQPTPTVATSGAISLIVEYYGTGAARPVTEPLPTITCVDRFALIQARGGDVLFRMLQPHELAAAQGFPSHYKVTGNKREQVKQIGNAVPVNLGTAVILSALSEQSDITGLVERKAA